MRTGREGFKERENGRKWREWELAAYLAIPNGNVQVFQDIHHH